ncbi:MAG: nickel pincer cofactor biosynthesis protein LarC [Dehalococcoidia bacterium]
MARVAYLDCFSGASGDMILGALIDAGLSLTSLRAEIAKLPLTGYRLSARRVRRAGLAATQVRVTVSKKQPPRKLADILTTIKSSSLPPIDKEKGSAIFQRLAEAEAKVHGLPLAETHLHEVGAVDAMVDVMGAVAGLRLLGAEEVFASTLALGSGRAESSGVSLPVPAPATLELVAAVGAPTVADHGGADWELLTPTGAAIITTLARFQRPAMKVEGVGYGAGGRDFAGWPNVLRVWLGTTVKGAGQTMLLAETNIDDMNPEILGYVQERLFASGAADVWLTPIQMKKGRPGVVLSVLCPLEAEDAIVSLLLRETSTLGVRLREVRRQVAEHDVLRFKSSLGPAVAKVKRLAGERPQAAPEYEVCRRLAEASGRPLAEVYRIVQGEALALLGKEMGGGER